METQRILVTGGSGFIGTNLCNELRSRGHEVLAVDLLHHEGEADLYSDSYSDYVRGDVRNYRQMERIFEDNDKFDYVYHLAAEYGRWNGEGYYENLCPCVHALFFPFLAASDELPTDQEDKGQVHEHEGPPVRQGHRQPPEEVSLIPPGHRQRQRPQQEQHQKNTTKQLLLHVYLTSFPSV